MIKRGVYLAVFLLTISLASASGIDFEKEFYQPGETLQAAIDFNFTLQRPLTQADFKLMKDSKTIAVTPFFKNLSNNKYYLTFQLPENLDSGSYLLNITNIFFIDN